MCGKLEGQVEPGAPIPVRGKLGISRGNLTPGATFHVLKQKKKEEERDGENSLRKREPS